MIKEKNYLADNEINFSEVIRRCWKEKILILFVSIACSLLSHIYQKVQPQEFKTVITIKDPPQNFLIYYNRFLNPKNNINSKEINKFSEQFILDLNSNLSSIDNLVKFIEKDNKYNNFNEYLKEKKITKKQYFKNNKFGQFKEKGKIISNKFFLIFPKELDGPTFLNDYVEFIKDQQIFEVKIMLKSIIQNKIIIYEEAFEIAKNINFEKPTLVPIISLNMSEENDNNALIYRGTKVLEQEIINLKKILLNLETDKLNYNIILDKALAPSDISQSLLLYTIGGLIFGLFLSLLVIFLRAIIKN